MKKYRTIIWDWNGTLLDDVDISLNGINPLLKERNLPEVEMSHYKEIFCFPVQRYYELLGFDFSKEPFDIPAKEYMDNYRKLRMDAKLSKGCEKILKRFQDDGLQQFVLSAMEGKLLEQMLKEYQIYQYFDGVYGLCNDYAVEKGTIGEKMIEEKHLLPEECVMVGDTLHDAEVAQLCGFDCILFSGGHFSEERLRRAKLPIVDELAKLAMLI